MDLYIEIKELKQRQEMIIAMLDDLMSGKAQEKIYDTVDLMKLLNVSKRTIASWKDQGILPHSQIRGKMWVTGEQLKEFLEKHSSVKTTTVYSLKRKGGRFNE